MEISDEDAARMEDAVGDRGSLAIPNRLPDDASAAVGYSKRYAGP
jgi:hypothetical protein